LRRFEDTLMLYSTETEKDLQYGILYQVGLLVKNRQDNTSFYGIDIAKFENWDGNPITLEDITNGKELAEYLRTTISLPTPSSKTYRKEMRKIVALEFQLLKEFFS